MFKNIHLNDGSCNHKKNEGVKVIARAKQPKTIDPSHSQICKAIVDYMRSKHPDKLFIHIPNEGKRSSQQGKKLKDEGLLPGAFDYLLCHVKVIQLVDDTFDYMPGVFIEVKTKKDKLSKTQSEFMERVLKAHYSVMVVNDIDEFIREIEEYCK